VGTSFLTELSVGSVIKTTGDVVIGTVASITDNTNLTLTGNAASTNSGINYHSQGVGPGDDVLIQGGDNIVINVANATCASIGGNNSGTGGWRITFNTGSQLAVAGIVTVGDAGHAGSIDMTNGGLLRASSLAVTNAGTWTRGAGTVELTGTSTLPTTFFANFNNLVISSGETTTSADLYINGNLTIADGASFVSAGFSLTANGGGTSSTTIGGAGAKLTINPSGGTLVFNGLVTVNSGGSWLNQGNTPVEFHRGITNNGTFIAGSGQQTFNINNQALTGNFIIDKASISVITLTNNNQLEITNALTGNGNLVQSGSSSILNINFPGVVGLTGILNASAAGNTVNYKNGSAQTVVGVNYSNLTLSGGGTKTLQSGTTNITGNLTLSGTTSTTAVGNLTISGNVKTDAGTTFHAGDFIHSIGGNFTNDGIFDGGTQGGTGTIVFNGTADQTISNSNANPLNHTVNVNINKPTGSVILGSDFTVVNALNMVQGNIILNTHNLTLGIDGGSNVGTLSHSGGTIVGSGKFIRWFTGDPIGSLDPAGLFPVGSSTDYRPLNIATASSFTPGTLAVEYHDAPGSTDLSSSPVSDGGTDIVLRDNFYWEITQPSITPLSDGTYGISVTANDLGGVGDVDDLRLMQASGVVGTAGSNGGTTTSPVVNRTAIAVAGLYNQFFIGSVDAVSSPLPIKLLSFTASAVNGSVRLDWETTSEINNDHFTIQRSRNSTAWENIKDVPGAINSSVNIKYSEYDETPYQGVSYYRLQQTDQDGKTSFSPIVSVKIGQSAAVNLYPNPVSDQIWITTSGSGRLNVALYNSNGRRVNVPVSTDGNKATINVSMLSAGTYFVHIAQGGLSESRVVIVAR
jgi:hypothetical protein